MISVLVVDDHPAICFAVKAVLEQPNKMTVHTSADGMSAMSMLKSHTFELVILDIALTKMDGLEILSRIHSLDPSIKVIILTGQNADLYAKRALKAGAVGFLSKDDDISKLAEICDLVMAGYSCFPSFCFDDFKHVQPMDQSDLMAKLSDRELTVLRYLSTGMSNKEIADRLLLSNKTISTYKTRLMEKLQINHPDEFQALLNSYKETKVDQNDVT